MVIITLYLHVGLYLLGEVGRLYSFWHSVSEYMFR